MIQTECQKGILVVDDDPAFVDYVRYILRDLGFLNVLSASGGYEAIEILKTKGASIDAVVTDLVMSEGTGVELILYLKKAHPRKVGAIVVTGYFVSFEAKSPLGDYQVPMFEKPFSRKPEDQAKRSSHGLPFGETILDVLSAS